MFISLSEKSLEQRFFPTPVIGVFVYHECTMRQHAEMGDIFSPISGLRRLPIFKKKNPGFMDL